jgi:multicomponent Na+:H+ antiporter subunit A
MTLVAAVVVLTGTTLATRLQLVPAIPVARGTLAEWGIVVLAIAGAAAVVGAGPRLTAVIALGVVGFSIALLFLAFGGIDLAITQFLIESLVVIVAVLALMRLPTGAPEPHLGRRFRVVAAAVAVATGALVTWLVWLVTSRGLDRTLSEAYARASVPAGRGRNIVNVILVDFRALDTLGEITVLATSAVGAWAVIRLRTARRRGRQPR